MRWKGRYREEASLQLSTHPVVHVMVMLAGLTTEDYFPARYSPYRGLGGYQAT